MFSLSRKETSRVGMSISSVIIAQPSTPRLHQDVLDDLAMNIGQAHVAAAETHRQALMVDTKQVQHGGVQVVDLDLIGDGLVAEFVGFSINRAALDAAAGQPNREAELIVIAAVAAL